jgi:hypothetical protein
MFLSYHRQTTQYLSQLVPPDVGEVGVEDEHQAVVVEGLGEELLEVGELQSRPQVDQVQREKRLLLLSMKRPLM